MHTNNLDGTNNPADLNRRTFLKAISAMSASAAGYGNVCGAAKSISVSNPILAFVKPFSKMPYALMAETLSSQGYDGIEATVRTGGQVTPERVAEELPRLCDALDKKNMRVHIMTCGVNHLRQPNAEQVLRTAAQCGIQLYRPSYYRYDLKKSIPEQVEALRPQLTELAAFNREHGLTMVYQNHSGATNVGAPLWDLHSLMKDHSPDEIAVALDIAHATIEGGLSWPVECRLMRPHMRALFVKDFQWRDRKVSWRPLGDGMVEPRFFDYFRETQFAGPISVHVEYIDDSDPNHIEKYIAAFGQDLKTLKRWLRPQESD